MKVTVFLLQAFVSLNGGGNPAGVVLNADDLNDEQKKQIAVDIGFSETAFVEKAKHADFKVTFFTPTEEVNICAHATIATYTLLLQKGFVQAKKYVQEIKAGTLPVEIKADRSVFMDQLLPTFSEHVSVRKIAEALDIDQSFINEPGLLPQIVSTGSRNILIPIKNREALFQVKPNREKLITLNKATETNGYKVFTLDTISPLAAAHSRDFAPYVGIPEESATGITTGSLACYLYRYNKLKGEVVDNLIFEQGYCMNQPSLINVLLGIENNAINRVQVGGKAILFGEKEITI